MGLRTHGMTGTPTWRIWQGMIHRCHKTYDASYGYYGGRGIRVCKEWHVFTNFHEWAMENGYKEGLSIERVNNNKGYNPKNCIWIPRNHQTKNTRVSLNYKGETSREASWRLGHTGSLVWMRVKMLGWDIERAFTTPSQSKKIKRK